MSVFSWCCLVAASRLHLLSLGPCIGTGAGTHPCARGHVIFVVVVVVVLTLNHSFYPTTSAVQSVLIVHPREIHFVW